MTRSQRAYESVIFDNIAIACDRQIHLERQIGDWDWWLDEDEGHIEFSKRRFFRKQRRTSSIQMLGSESYVSDTWLWAWANPEQGTPEPLLEAARSLRKLGRDRDVGMFAEAQFDLDTTDGHTIAALATSLTGAAGYFRCPYDGGAAFVLLTSPEFVEHVERPVLHVSARFPQILQFSAMPDHRRVFLGYVEQYGLATTKRNRSIRAVDEATGDEIQADFDKKGRLYELTASLSGADSIGSPV